MSKKEKKNNDYLKQIDYVGKFSLHGEAHKCALRIAVKFKQKIYKKIAPSYSK